MANSYDAHKWENYLTQHCYKSGLATPRYDVGSDRRGGRTGWTCWVLVQGQSYKARFSYDDVDRAREDASELALQELGVIAKPPPLSAAATPEQLALFKRMVMGPSAADEAKATAK